MGVSLVNCESTMFFAFEVSTSRLVHSKVMFV